MTQNCSDHYIAVTSETGGFTLIKSGFAPVLVTGGCGYVGSHVVLALLEAGFEVFVIDDLSTGLRANLDPRARFYEGGIENNSLVRGLIQMRGITTLVHLAGTPDAGDSSVSPMTYYRSNVSASRSLFESALQCGVRHFVLSSSGQVYGAPGEGRIAETAQQVPRTAYAKSEWMKERIFVDSADVFWVGYCILRYFDAVGGAAHYRRSGRAAQNGLLTRTIQAAIGRRKPLRLPFHGFATRDGSPERDYVSVQDVAQAHVVAIEKLIADPGWRAELNCSTGRGVTISELVSVVERVTMLKVPSSSRDGLPDEMPSLVLDNSALRQQMGWAPEHTAFEALVREAYRVELNQQQAAPERVAEREF